MAKFYKCRYCGNVIEKHHEGSGEIECCGLGMDELIPNTVDASLSDLSCKPLPLHPRVGVLLGGRH